MAAYADHGRCRADDCRLRCAAVFGRGLIPELKEGHFVVHLATVPGTSIEGSLQVGARIADALLKLPEVRSVAQRAGRAEESEDTFGPHYSELEVALKPGLSGDDTEKAEADIRRTLAGFVGVSASVMTF